MATKTINLTGAEIAVTGLDGAHAHIRNDGTDTIYASKTAGITAGADGVASIPAGQADTLRGISGTVYLLGTGSVLVQSDDYVASPFKASATSGGSGADNVARAAISTHAGNTEIHVTTADKSAWNAKADLSDIPDTLPANGGNADTVGGKQASDFLPNKAPCVYGADYDSFTTSGFFEVLGNSSGLPTQNAPNGNNTSNNFYLLVQSRSDQYCNQIAVSVRTDLSIYVRTLYNGVWTSWTKINDGGNALSVGEYTEAKLAALEARVAALEGGT